MRKKKLCLALATVMMLSLAACGSKEQSKPMLDELGKDNGSYSNNSGQQTLDDLGYSGGDNFSAYDSYSDSDVVAPDFNTEEYDTIKENSFVKVGTQPLSTFAADVDTGSYCNFRRMVQDDIRADEIPSGALRTEEMVNYFDYEITDNSDKRFTVNSEIHPCPWNEENSLLVLKIKANEVPIVSSGNNFVYLIDTSGSMAEDSKIGLATDAFIALTKSLDDKDTVSVVTYAADFDTIIEGSSNKNDIIEAIKEAEKRCKESGGGTNGSGGIDAAYEVAEKNFKEDGNNRVIIASDGDMNLGVTSNSGLVDLIEEKKESGVFLTTLGFGSGNYSDANMESIADAGNGNYYYIDCLDEAKRVLCDKLMETTVTVAKDVKMQVEFNPNYVAEYRLIGYENRTIAADDFEDDTKDGGEVGAGQQTVVCYELKLGDGNNGQDLKYQEGSTLTDAANSNELLTLSINYKEPDGNSSQTEDYPVFNSEGEMSEDFAFISGVIETSLVLRDSDYKGTATIDSAKKLAKQGVGNDEYRVEFTKLLNNLE